MGSILHPNAKTALKIRAEIQNSDDVYICLKPHIQTLSRSNLHRCLTRNVLNRLPREDEQGKKKNKFKDYEIGYVHVDITEINNRIL